MPGYIDKIENVAVVVPTSATEFALFCRTAMKELKPTLAVRPKVVPMSNEHLEKILRGININRQRLKEVDV